MYSQGSEESAIVDYFGAYVGRFLDIGAWTGTKFSNTCRLAELGWHGVCVEPSPAACAALLRTHGGNPAIRVVCAAVALEAGWRVFHDAGGDGISSLIAETCERWAGSTFRPVEMCTVTPAQLVGRFGPAFDFVSIDTEGMSREILKRLPLSEMGTRLICVEHDGREADVLAHCAEHGLTDVLLRNGENVIVAKSSPLV